MRKRQKGSNKDIFPSSLPTLEQILQQQNLDISFSTYDLHEQKVAVFFIDYLTDTNKAQASLLKPLLAIPNQLTNSAIMNHIPLQGGETIQSLELIIEKLLSGTVFIYLENEKEALSYKLAHVEKRSPDKAETESLVVGPKIAFNESITTNMNIIRSRVQSSDLIMEPLHIGKTNSREVRIVYMKSIANDEDVQTIKQRIQDLDIDEVEDSIILKQYIEDSQLSFFPQFDSTELPDRFTYAITRGKVGVLVDNSSTGIIAPATLFSFLQSTEDIYMRWNEGTILRFIRFIAVFISFFLTPAYVAIVTYQFGIIPTQLLISLGKSRAAVPFPPFLEAILLEFLIELLREAGARLPTKVGQTMGIVGGIVIGQAAVQAGLTSNILIIVVAMSALASFTSPNYLLGTTVRLLRFPLIFLAGLFGLFGIVFGISLLVIHLLRLKSLGRPYLLPLYPLKLKDFNKSFFRAPLPYEHNRAISYRPKFLFRFNKKEAAKKRDIDE